MSSTCFLVHVSVGYVCVCAVDAHARGRVSAPHLVNTAWTPFAALPEQLGSAILEPCNTHGRASVSACRDSGLLTGRVLGRRVAPFTFHCTQCRLLMCERWRSRAASRHKASASGMVVGMMIGGGQGRWPTHHPGAATNNHQTGRHTNGCLAVTLTKQGSTASQAAPTLRSGWVGVGRV
jgi:hypothetical protein